MIGTLENDCKNMKVSRKTVEIGRAPSNSSTPSSQDVAKAIRKHGANLKSDLKSHEKAFQGQLRPPARPCRVESERVTRPRRARAELRQVGRGRAAFGTVVVAAGLVVVTAPMAVAGPGEGQTGPDGRAGMLLGGAAVVAAQAPHGSIHKHRLLCGRWRPNCKRRSARLSCPAPGRTLRSTPVWLQMDDGPTSSSTAPF